MDNIDNEKSELIEKLAEETRRRFYPSGSASSFIACHKLGFEYIGFELDADYFKSAKDRILVMFLPKNLKEYGGKQ